MLKLLLRYGMAGLLNTAIGYAVIAGLDIGLGVDSHLANLAGYGVGGAISYFLQRSFVFESSASHRRSVPRYLLAALTAFLINQMVLSISLQVIGDATLGRAVAQLVAVASYSVTLLVLLRLWVFDRERPP